IYKSFDLIKPEKKDAMKEAQIQEGLGRLGSASNINVHRYEVAVSHVGALIAAEQLRLAIVDTLTQSQILAMSQQQYDEGRLLLSLLNQAKADRNTALNNLEEAQQIYDNNKVELLYALGYGPEEEVDIVFEEDLGAL